MNNLNAYHRTPLMIAAEKGHIDCVALLLQHPNIDVNIVDNVLYFSIIRIHIRHYIVTLLI